MGRNKVSIPVNAALLRGAITKRMRLPDAAEKIGVSRQAMSAWLQEERIPPRRMADLAQCLDLSTEEVSAILAKQESVKDLARELAKVREENYRLKQAIAALIEEAP